MNTSEKQRGESPTMPVSSDEADVPLEDAVCAQFIDSSFSESDTASSRTASPCLSAAIRKELEVGSSSNIITKTMMEEESRLQAEGMRKEEERQKTNQMLLDDVDESTEMRYERLKYLLSKSTLYTEYLVGRMKKQKEEQEKRKERMMKRKAKMEEHAKDKQTTPSTNACDVPQTRKRKAEDISPNCGEKRVKREKMSYLSSEENPIPAETDNGSNHQDENAASLKTEPEDGNEDQEPELLEKAVTYGLDEDDLGPRYINGEEVPSLQPKFMEGGVLRPYQVEGYSWLKILYENGVNGILADEMGLGKTVQCVAMLAHLVQMGIPGPFLVCAPLSTIPNWLAELQRFAPKVPTILYHGVKDERARMAKKIQRRHKVHEGLYVKPVVITSYEIAMIDRRYLAYNDWKYLIVDEGHRIKNTHCRLIRELRMYHSTHRLLLTGTPLQNNMAELWSLLNFLLPEIFDDKGSFETWFDANCMDDEASEEQIVKQEQGKNILGMLHQILSPFMLRRLKSDVDLCIPPKKEVLVYAPLTREQKEFYAALVDRTIFNLLEEKNEKPEEKVELNAAGHPKRRSALRIIDYSTMMEDEKDRKCQAATGSGRSRWKDLEEDEKELESWIMAVNNNKAARKSSSDERPKTSQVTIKMRNVMMQLRKCCNHPYLLEHPLDPQTGDLALTEGVVNTSGKMLVLDQMLQQLHKDGHKVLIFSQMTRMLDLIEDFCEIRKYEFCRLDGSTSVDDRRDSMKEFNDPKAGKFLFLLSTRAGGLGINLTGADTVIIYDSDWNPQCDLQAQDRCHRIGQTKPVVVYRFVTANTIDQKIIERAANKRKLEKMIIHKGSFKSGNFIHRSKPISAEELRDLLQSKDHTSEVKNQQFVISRQQLRALLDRSDLYRQWEISKKAGQPQDQQQSSPKSASAPTNKKAKNSSKGTGGKAKTSPVLFKVMDPDTPSKCSEGPSACGDSSAVSTDGDSQV